MRYLTVFLSPPRQMPEQYLNSAIIASFELLSQFIIYHPTIGNYAVSILKALLNNPQHTHTNVVDTYISSVSLLLSWFVLLSLWIEILIP